MTKIIYKKHTKDAERSVKRFMFCYRSTKEFDKLFTRLEERYKIKRYYTDDYPVYKELIPFNRHKTGKKYTQQIENLNGRIRHYIKGFNRKSKGYFKTEKMMYNILKLFFWGDVN